MIKRNLSSVLVIIAMLLNIIGFDFQNVNTASRDFWLFLGATMVLIASVILIFVNESKNNKNQN